MINPISGSGLDGAHNNSTATANSRRLLVLAALGIVFGDIGTSPLYAFRECATHAGEAISPAVVLGVLSLMTWVLLLIVTGKYAWLILRADNEGEGGILALMALARRSMKGGGRVDRLLVFLGILGAALFFADGAITPAISVLSAVEGLQLMAPGLASLTIPVTIVILIGLFAMQRHGTRKIGILFGPIVLVWFITLGIMGITPIIHNPGIFAALNPMYGLQFLLGHGWHGFAMVGYVFLVATGAEALYADLGHFGRRPIRIAWLGVALPALLLNYFGQGALVLANPQAAENPFFYMVSPALLPALVVLATAATIIASQAVISGAFSMARQAVMLGLVPRLDVRHTSGSEIGQVYVPMVNWTLFAGTIGLVLGFGSSSRLASAYGLAVALTMLITAFLLAIYLRKGCGWSISRCVLILLPLLLIHGVLVTANFGKLISGGWLPLMVGAAGTAVMFVWRRGQQLLQGHTDDVGLAEADFLNTLPDGKITRVQGTAIVVTRLEKGIPLMLLHLMKATKSLHETVVIVTIDVANRAKLPEAERLSVESFGDGLYRVRGRYGFMESPNVPAIVKEASRRKLLPKALPDCSYFLGRIVLTEKRKPILPWFPRRLFMFLFHNARQASQHLGIPSNRCIEIGIPVEI
jgi:KUP system potassium uptake protein